MPVPPLGPRDPPPAVSQRGSRGEGSATATSTSIDALLEAGGHSGAACKPPSEKLPVIETGEDMVGSILSSGDREQLAKHGRAPGMVQASPIGSTGTPKATKEVPDKIGENFKDPQTFSQGDMKTDATTDIIEWGDRSQSTGTISSHTITNNPGAPGQEGGGVQSGLKEIAGG